MQDPQEGHGSCSDRLLQVTGVSASLLPTGPLNWVVGWLAGVGSASHAPWGALPSSGPLSILQSGRRYREGLPYQGHPGCSPKG